MNRYEFKNWTNNNIIYLDGATGTNLMKAGMPKGVCPEMWIMENPEAIKKLQRDYVSAGSNIVYAPTFGANRIKLEEYGLQDRIEEINKTLVKLSKEAVGGKALVAGDITMTGQQLYPIGTLKFEELVDVYKEQVALLADAGADLIVVETMMSLQETRAAVIAVKEVCDLPVIATLSFEENGRTLFGSDAKTSAIVLAGLGVDAVGVNCSTGPDKMVPIVEAMRRVVDIPIIAKPNAGLPVINEAGETVYSLDASGFAEQMEALVKAGASILGGCCGTSPEYIRAISDKFKGYTRSVTNDIEEKYYLTSERHALGFGLDGRFLVIGERINPTGKKKLQEELRGGSLETVLRMAEEQEEYGADILDVNLGMSGIDEKEMMLRVITELTQATNLPLSIDSSHVDVIEAALRIYPGRALINSISLEMGKAESLMPLAKKYGAAFILLPLSDEGLPKNMEEKHEIINTLIAKAKEYGLCEKDIIVDGLVTTVGANKNAALETLETIRYCKEELGVATTVGLSNISFGLPERITVNTAFLTLAIQKGLTLAIANPMQDPLMKAMYATDLLLNKEGADIRYIEAVAKMSERASVEVSVKTPVESNSKTETVTKASASDEAKQNKPKVYTDILKGNRNGVVEHVKEALNEGASPDSIINEMLIPAINEVGDLFEKQIYFLPQLISAAETMKLAIEYVEPMLVKDNDDDNKVTIVIATVEGDIHDIGKNLVVLMMKNYGYRVIDLGKNVSCEEIINTAIRENAAVIGLSALMTTTMMEMKKVVEYAKSVGCTAKIIIGGAVITDDFAKEIGADGYSKDAAAAVKLVESLL